VGGTCDRHEEDEERIQNLPENLKGTDHLRDLGVCDLKLWIRLWTGSNWLRIGSSGGFCELCNNEPFGRMKGGEFLDQPTDCHLLCSMSWCALEI